MTTTYLITGASRGIGRGLLEHYLAKPNVTAIAAVRDPLAAGPSLDKISKGPGSKLITVKMDASSPTDALDAANELREDHGITKIDTIIAAAAFVSLSPLSTLPLSSLHSHVTTNAYSILLLFQAFLPLLQSSPFPKLLYITANAASLTAMPDYPIPHGAYSASKAMANALVRKIALENEWLVAFMVHPGWVQSDMGNGGARSIGMEEAPVRMEECVGNLREMIDDAGREDSGRFYDMKRGVDHAW